MTLLESAPSEQSRLPLTQSHLNPDRTLLTNRRLAEACAFDHRAKDLHAKLLSFGGDEVLLYPCGGRVVFLEELLRDGRLSQDSKVVLRKGQPSRCHANAARYWAGSGGRLKLVSGYGLSEDGLWRQHSWNMKKDGTLVESTDVRLEYYGAVLDDVTAWKLLKVEVFPQVLERLGCLECLK